MSRLGSSQQSLKHSTASAAQDTLASSRLGVLSDTGAAVRETPVQPFRVPNQSSISQHSWLPSRSTFVFFLVALHLGALCYWCYLMYLSHRCVTHHPTTKNLYSCSVACWAENGAHSRERALTATGKFRTCIRQLCVAFMVGKEIVLWAVRKGTWLGRGMETCGI